MALKINRTAARTGPFLLRFKNELQPPVARGDDNNPPSFEVGPDGGKMEDDARVAAAQLEHPREPTRPNRHRGLEMRMIPI